MSQEPQTPEAIEKAEKARAQYLAIQAKRKANTVSASIGFVPKKVAARRRVKTVRFLPGQFQRGFSSSIALGSAAMRQVLANAERLAHEADRPARILVQNGKALTPEGEALLKRHE